MFLRWLEKEKGIPKVADSVKIIYPKKPGNRRLLLETCEKILEAMRKVAPLRDQIAVSLMLLTGCRSCEIARLTIDDIDFERMIIVYHGKGGIDRTVPLPPVMVEPLRRYIAQRKPSNPGERKVFLNRYGRGFKESSYNLCLNKYLRRARILAGITEGPSGSHTFRHTFITEMERNHKSLEDIMKIVGIKNMDNLQIYLDLEKREVREEFMQRFNLGGRDFAPGNQH
ncbi:site-specific integrase [Neomoorella humiferrea]|uniref:tyrosine-type recombinase/integrase n=1 Tax=Neomoorella humiferrea TaxID=676965 RepID=UPI003D8B372E